MAGEGVNAHWYGIFIISAIFFTRFNLIFTLKNFDFYSLLQTIASSDDTCSFSLPN